MSRYILRKLQEVEKYCNERGLRRLGKLGEQLKNDNTMASVNKTENKEYVDTKCRMYKKRKDLVRIFRCDGVRCRMKTE